MQAGFAMVESGLSRAKNTANVLMKNFMDFSVGSIMFFLIGWAFMFGSHNGFIGLDQFGLVGLSEHEYIQWFFQVVFAGASATIISGSLAERTRFSGYLIGSVFVMGFIYPIAGGWVWNGGWLAQMGFHDFAGSTVVHSLGGWIALVASMVLGPRRGKYSLQTNGKVKINPIAGHSIPLAALGTFILWFGWYGFNVGSTLSATDPRLALVATTTTLAAGGGAIAAMFTTWLMFKKPDTILTLNGALAGLVGITAGTYVIHPGYSIVVGVIAGILVVFSTLFIERRLKIDDVVGAVSVHGVCGLWGTLAVAFFGDLELIGSGLSRGQQIGVQSLGAGAYFVWAILGGLIVYGSIKKLGLLRANKHEELMGLDITEHGNESYSGFQVFSNT